MPAWDAAENVDESRDALVLERSTELTVVPRSFRVGMWSLYM